MFRGSLKCLFRTQFIESTVKSVSYRSPVVYLPHFYRAEMSCDIPEDPGAKGGQEADSDWVA